MISGDEVFQAIERHLHKLHNKTDLKDLETIPVSSLLVSSLDVIELAMDLETDLQLEDETISLEKLAPKFVNLSFRELATEVANLINTQDSSE